ncbi:S1C family serine protease [Schlesneria paludicola]|uniref:S1C family serine protease n=1 Tax=Schlesneria paludicola TaxID=360056 RepID=UPI0002E45446|nr:trypsin-like peptidase domain-containing protein [Schlesneria paludicola]
MKSSITLCSKTLWSLFFGLIALNGESLVAADPAVLEAQQSRMDIVNKAAKTVVAIFSPDGNGGGSGVLVTPDGYALSNYHVTSACGDFMKCGLNDGVLYDAVIVGIDPTGDVALLKLLGRTDFPHAPLGDSDLVSAGDWTYAMGNPFLLATDFQPTVTFGMVSGVHRYQYPAGTFLEYTDCIQVDTSINPGNSGGPLFNAAGELIGINGRIAVEKRGRVNIGAGYAISINQIKHFMDQLRGGQIVDHATLGATVRSGSDRTVLVDSILETSDVYRRGLREDDEIISFAGRPIGSVNQFKNILGIYPSGWSLPLVYRRDGKKNEIIVQLPALHQRSEIAKSAGSKQPHPERHDPDGPPHSDGTSAQLPKDELPDEYKQLFEKKAGYANYYFNRLEQQRVLAGLERFANWHGAVGKWNLSGRTADGDTFQLKLYPQALTAQFTKRAPGLQNLDGTDFLDEPPGTGGLLAALYQFKLLLTEGPTAFNEVFYDGSQPLDGRAMHVDVLVTKKSTLECRWYFRASDGTLIGFDSSLGIDSDSCDIRFLQYGEFQGNRFPNRWMVRYGDTEYGIFDLIGVEASTSTGTDKPTESNK